MAEHEHQTRLGWFQPVVVAVLVALLAGGTSPWWFQDLKATLQNSGLKTFNLVGDWTGSPDCTVHFFLDDGKNVKGVCDNGDVSHSITGGYLNNKTVALENVRRDQNGCEIKVDASITFRDKNVIEYSQAGWIGCDKRTSPSKRELRRDAES